MHRHLGESAVHTDKRRRVQLVCKRTIDVLFSLLAMLLLSPVYVAIALAILSRMGPPVLFRQRRPGKSGMPFTIYKFRTMLEPHTRSRGALSEEERQTGLGRFLRRTSLDELPELFNVLRGEMSLVGPRPLLTEYLDLYTPEQARRHDVRPGITGWAQVNGRNTLTWEEKFERDVWYVDQWSLTTDLKIMWLTVIAVLRRDGINAPGYTTMPRFAGTSKE